MDKGPSNTVNQGLIRCKREMPGFIRLLAHNMRARKVQRGPSKIGHFIPENVGAAHKFYKLHSHIHLQAGGGGSAHGKLASATAVC